MLSPMITPMQLKVPQSFLCCGGYTVEFTSGSPTCLKKMAIIRSKGRSHWWLTAISGSGGRSIHCGT